MTNILADFCNVSYVNIFLLFAIGIVFRFLSSIYDSGESNSIELSIALMSRIGCFACVVFSCVALIFNGKNLVLNSYNDYKTSCRDNSFAMLGGNEGLINIEDEFASLGMDVEIAKINDVDDMAETAKQTVLILTEKEMDMLGELDL